MNYVSILNINALFANQQECHIDSCCFVLFIRCPFSTAQVQKYLAWVYNKVALTRDAAHTALLKSHYCKQ